MSVEASPFFNVALHHERHGMRFRDGVAHGIRAFPQKPYAGPWIPRFPVRGGPFMGKIERPSLESLIMDFAMSLTRRATCKRAQCSCVVTPQDMTQIYGLGYSGRAKGFSHDV